MLHLRDVTARAQHERELQRMAWTDYLTGLPNRARLMAALESPPAPAPRPGQPACVLLIDLDGFKTVNDVAGHDAGDLLLTEVADRLRAAARDRDLVARLGGDEFALVVAAAPRRPPRSPSGSSPLLDRPAGAAEPDGAAGRRLRRLRAASASPSSSRPTTPPTPSARPTSRCAPPRRRARAASGTGRATPLDERHAAAGPGSRATSPPPSSTVQLRLEYQPVAGFASGGSSASRRSSGGTTRCWAPCRPTSSSPSPRTTA